MSEREREEQRAGALTTVNSADCRLQELLRLQLCVAAGGVQCGVGTAVRDT